MTEVTTALQWLPRKRTNGCSAAGRRVLRRPAYLELQLLAPSSGSSGPTYINYTEMKRKVVNTGKLRLSPNEEALILKEDYERRRKLRLLQVREQERDIASQIRQGIKQRRNQQFTRLAEELRAEWEESQNQKIQNLEKLYVASLRNMGAGHQQAKENEPDLDALAWRAAERKRKADLRHKEALKVQKHQKEMLMKQKTWHIKARKEALLVEKERSAKITSLPPPPPALFENIEVKRISAVKTNSSTYHHLYTFVNKQVDTKQPDAHLAAEEEAKRLEELQKQAAQERMEQSEKAHARGFQAMKKIHLAQNQEKVMKELKQLQQEDLARRRQTVAQMPPQLVELPYRRSEMKEDWQRELEFAFEDMYNADRKVKGNLILHLAPEPLPTVTDLIQDEELNLSMEQENLDEAENLPVTEAEIICSSETDVPLAVKTQQIPSKVLFRKLLNKIRSQKSLWTIKSMSEDENEMDAMKMIMDASETESSKAPTIESGAIDSEERTLSAVQEQVESDALTIESGPLTSEDKALTCTDSGKKQEINETPPIAATAQSAVLLHPQEEATVIRMSARQKQIMEIEEQKQKQLELLERIEQQKLRLETDCFRAQLEEKKRKEPQQTGVGAAPASCTVICDEDNHRQMIRNYQHQLLQQNRLHRQSIETAKKRLLEYQAVLRERYPSMSAPSSTASVPSQKSERLTAVSEYYDQGQRPKLSSNKYQPIQLTQISKLEQDHFQVPRQNYFLQRPVETTEIFSTSGVLAKQSLESQERLGQFSPTEMQQRDYKLVPKDSHILSRALSDVRPLILQDATKISETLRATAFQTLHSQQILSEDSESISSKLTEPSSFLPLAPQHSFSSLPVKVESGKNQEPFSTANKSAVSISHSVISQMHDRLLPYSEDSITAQQGNLKALQEQLDLQKDVLQARREAQEQLLLSKQKELEQQTGLSVFLPLVAPDSSALLPSAKAELGRIQESSPTKTDTAVSSDHPVVPQLQDRLLSSSQPILSQKNSLKFLQEQLNIQRDILQARREAQEVLCVHKQRESGGRECSQQAELSSLPFQIAQHTFTSLPSADTKYGKIQQQYPSKSEKGLLLSQSEISKSQDRSSGFLQQFLPLHESLKSLQEQMTTQRDTLQARPGAQPELLLHRQRDLGDKSGQMSSFSPMVQHSVASQASAKAEPSRIQKHYFLEKENIIPSSNLISSTFQDKSFVFPHRSLPQQENLTAFQEQSHIQRVIVGTKEELQRFVYKQSESEKIISSEQTGTSSSVSQVAESERFQECMSIENDSTVPLSHLKVPRFQDRLLRFSQHILPLQGNLEEHQEWLDPEKDAFHFSWKTQENTSSEQTVSSSFIPQLVQRSFTSLRSAESGTTQEALSTENGSKISSGHLQIPQLQDRLLRISQLIQPQQDNLKALQEQLATQREAIIQSRREAQEELVLQKQSEWKGRVSPQLINTSSLALLVQHSLASLPLTGSENTQEPCPTNSDDNTVSSGPSEIPRLPDRLLGLSYPVLPQQDNLITSEEHSHAQINSLPSIEKTQKELVLPKPCKFEEEISSEHFIQPCHGDLQAFQQQLDIQRKAIRSRQEVQEEMLFERLSKLEKRVSSEQIGSSTGQLDSEREVVYSSEEPQDELLLNKQSKLNKSEYAEHAVPSLFLPKDLEHSFIPLPFAEGKSKSICELCSAQNEHAISLADSVIPGIEARLLSFSQPILAQQDNLGLQKQLDIQKEVLHYSQKAQEELLVQRKTALQQQIQKHQETLTDVFKDSQPTVASDLKTQKMGQLRECLPHIQDLSRDDQENSSHADRSNSNDNELVSEDTSAKQSGEHLDKELGRRSSKPPVAKVKYGLDLNQHELSAIQELESPASDRPSILGKLDFYQDRDPMRVSVSREQSFLGSPLARDPFGCLQPNAQENVYGDDYNEPVKVKKSILENHAVLSYAVEEEEHTYLGLNVKPDNEAKTQEISHEPLSSGTVSTGSFLSYENTDLSFTDPGSFAEHMDDREQESTTDKEDETNILSSIVPSIQVIYQRHNSSESHKSLLPAVEEFTSGHTHSPHITDKYINEANLILTKTDLRVDLDFPELEQIFPNLHRQLFKPLEPHPDFDSSPSSGISQDNRDFYQSPESSSENHRATISSKSTVSFTALRRTSLHSSLNTSLDQQPDTNLAHAAAQSFATENIIEGSEQSFQQLLPEFSSQEGSQHADLPSIFSIEARDSFQGMENQNYSSEEHTEILQNKKKSDFQLSVGNVLSSVSSSSDEANVFDQLNVQHSTPCGSTSSRSSIKQQLESRKETLGFEELSERGVVTMLQSQGLIEVDKNETGRVVDINPHVDEIDSQLCVRTVEMGTSVHPSHSVTMRDENSTETETPKIIKTLSQLGQSELSINSGSFSLQNSIPTWETESGHGIMEEPELTLVSTSDNSIAEADFANLTLEEKRENEAESCFQVSEFLPFVSETEVSDCPAASELSIETSTVSAAETLPKFTPIPGSLQEAFVKRKKTFMERSCQRQKEIRNKIRVSENSQMKIVPEKPTIGSSVSGLKGVNKIRASLSPDGHMTQALMQQRALRLYNPLAKVKQQNEEKSNYAQNRARAREFHKKQSRYVSQAGLQFLVSSDPRAWRIIGI
ncbi:centrosomal protein of 295 kDa isoform X3 [Microcebus murinus]|uniref:centrosomal protein of 295 kDa isoform X3 n=1 Tax=Microcebus murinus TaxID=30608 RepID=UPI003F6CF6FD